MYIQDSRKQKILVGNETLTILLRSHENKGTKSALNHRITF